MWLDGLNMAEPSYAEFASTFHHPEALNDIAKQFALIDEHTREGFPSKFRIALECHAPLHGQGSDVSC
jgi:hypothetical protein